MRYAVSKKQETRGFIHLHCHTEYCLGPHTRIAMADLTWKKASEIRVGEVLVGFDEDLRGKASKMRPATVEAVSRVVRPCYQIVMEDGRSIVASDKHGWVTVGSTRGSQEYPGGPRCGYGSSTRRWLTTDNLMAGTYGGGSQPGRVDAKLVQWAEPWDELHPVFEREGGWLAGMADGEAWLHGSQLSFGQNPGPVLDELLRVCDLLGYETTDPVVQSSSRDCRVFSLRGYATVVRFLGQCRPVRFRDRTGEVWDGRRPGRRFNPPVAIRSVTFLGEQETVAIQTDTRTLVAEGFLSHNSVLDGMCRVARGKLSIRGKETRGTTLAARAAEMGMPAVAITDHGTLGGFYRFAHECVELGVRPIVGIEFYVAGDMRRKDREARFEDDHLVVIAQNWEGFAALTRLSNAAHIEGFYQRPRIDERLLLQEADSPLIVLSGCVSGKLARLAHNGRIKEAKAHVGRMLNAFGGRYFVELQPHPFDLQFRHNEAALDVARETNAPIVATNDAHYLRREDSRTHEALLCVQTGSKLTDEDRFRFTGDSFHLCTREEMIEQFNLHVGLPKEAVLTALEQTVKVAGLVDFQVPDAIPGLVPKANVPSWVTAREGPGRDAPWFLRNLCEKALEAKSPDGQEVYQERLDHELSVIWGMGYVDYFLTAWELYQWVESRGIMRGPGRGSAAGSLVAYLLGITLVDPILHGLQFERFLNPARLNPPDIDMDFADDRRDEVIGWFSERFGAENVARIGTWGTLQGKSALRDSARVHGVRPDVADRAAELVGDELSDDEPALKTFRAEHGEAWGVARKIEGLVRAKGSHASGIVASPRLREVMPLERRSGNVTTALTGKEVEKVGFLKWDILGLSGLQAVGYALDLIEASGQPRPDLASLDLDDADVLADLSDGKTVSVFQFDSFLAARECASMTFEVFDDVVLMSALQRPGTARSGTSQLYYERRRGERETPERGAIYDQVTAGTLGVVVFEEQVTELFRDLAGWTMAEADKARVIVAKSQGSDKFEALRAGFVKGAVAHGGMTASDADALFDELATFSGYAFNRAHATSYSYIAFWTAWLRRNYPAQWWAAALTTEAKKEKAGLYALEARKWGVQFARPDVSQSEWGYTIGATGLVIPGWIHVLGVGEKAAEEIRSKRPFADLHDFLDRVDLRVVNRACVKQLATCGAFGSLEPNTKGVAEGVEDLVGQLRKTKKRTGWERSLFADQRGGPVFGPEEEWTHIQVEDARLSVLPVPFAGNPLDRYVKALDELRVDWTPLASVFEPTASGDTYHWLRGFCIESEVKRRKKSDRTGAFKKGSPFGELHLVDGSGAVRVRADTDKFNRCQEVLRAAPGKALVVLAHAFPEGAMYFLEDAILAEDALVDGDGMQSWLRRSPVPEEDLAVDEVTGSRPKEAVGVVVSVRRARSRRGGEMGWVLVMGRDYPREVVLWEREWRRFRKHVQEGAAVRMRCRRHKSHRMLMVDLKKGDWVKGPAAV